MSVLQPDYFPAGINTYVPAMQYADDVIDGKVMNVSLGTPSAADDDGIHADIDGDGSLVTIYAADFAAGSGGLGRVADANYGRNVVISPSGDPGATGVSIRVYGEDYLGQPMSETLTVANGGSADAVGKKAFKRITKIALTVAATNAITVDVGWGALLGLPYKIAAFLHGYEGSTLVYHGTPTIAAPDTTDPATATTGDPRGTYSANDAPNGSREYIVNYTADSRVNASGNGGLHGIAHFHV